MQSDKRRLSPAGAQPPSQKHTRLVPSPLSILLCASIPSLYCCIDSTPSMRYAASSTSRQVPHLPHPHPLALPCASALLLKLSVVVLHYHRRNTLSLPPSTKHTHVLYHSHTFIHNAKYDLYDEASSSLYFSSSCVDRDAVLCPLGHPAALPRLCHCCLKSLACASCPAPGSS
jgi:hypothetical protein